MHAHSGMQNADADAPITVTRLMTFYGLCSMETRPYRVIIKTGLVTRRYQKHISVRSKGIQMFRIIEYVHKFITHHARDKSTMEADEKKVYF